MKKIILAAALAATAFGANAADPSELRIYINPGHGSWTANDRPMPVKGHGGHSRYNTDTLSFFESNTNLRKGFGVLEKLRAMGLEFDETLNQEGERRQIGAARDLDNNIVMSHVKCGPYHEDNPTAGQMGSEAKLLEAFPDAYHYNRNLTEICEEVEENLFDMFISIHSNAATGNPWSTTNFPIILYRGYDDCRNDKGVDSEHSKASRAMAEAVWPLHMADAHGAWTAYSITNPDIRGDIDFYHSSSTSKLGYKGYLGVLKHSAPGFLVEGYFHTYSVAALRHMNFDVDYIEGYNYAHGIADYFGLEKEKVGDVYGIVRDEHERYSSAENTYLPVTTSDDLYKPIENATVQLKKDGQVVAEYITDNYLNGCFVFKGVEPGTYLLTVNAEGYKTPKATEIEVKAAEITYPKLYMESESYVAPTENYVNYPDELLGTQYGPRADFTFATALADVDIEALHGLAIRRMLVHGDYLYVLGLNEAKEATILILDNQDLKVVATPGVEGAEGTELNISDIAVTADGVLLACSMELCHFSADYVNQGEEKGVCNIYRWNLNEDTQMPDGNPYVWVSTEKSGNFYRAYTGETMLYSGTTEEGRVVLTSETASGIKIFMSVIDIIANQVASESHRNNGAVADAGLNGEALGEHINMWVSPLADDSFFIDGDNSLPMAVTLKENGALEGFIPEGLIEKGSVLGGFFKYSGRSYMVSTKLDADGKNIGVTLLDVTDGAEKATVVDTYNTELAGAEGVSAATGFTRIVRNPLDEITGVSVELYVLRDNGKITRLSTAGVRQLQNKREFAYDIVVAEDGDNYTVTFKSTGKAVKAEVVLTNKNPELASDVMRFAIEGVEKGENSITFNRQDLSGNKYSVAVEITGNPISEVGAYLVENTTTDRRGGVVTITDTESDNLGYVAYTIGASDGTYVFAPDGTKEGPFFVKDSRLSGSNQSSMFRGDERNGKFVFADWSDVGAGYWVVDPRNPSEMTQLLGGDRSGADGSKGSYYYNGEIIGGGSSCVAFQGKGEDTKMYSFLEDYPAGNTAGSQNKVYRYTIGDAEQITTAPDMVFESLNGGAFLANQNVDITAVENGFFVTQCRGAGNNASGCPAWAYISNEGEVYMTSADYDFIDSGNSGFAINADRTLAAAAQYDNITVMSVAWNEYDEPEFTKLYTIPMEGQVTWSHLKFDIGNNIHAYLRENGGYYAFSLPSEAPVTRVAAKSIYEVTGSNSGVEEVSVEAEEVVAPVYYNLNGVRVNAENLTPGIYVKVVGEKATKVIVK